LLLNRQQVGLEDCQAVLELNKHPLGEDGILTSRTLLGDQRTLPGNDAPSFGNVLSGLS
jgi:hypothetical protein